MEHGLSFADPSQLKVSTLLLRGEWDDYPNDKDARNFINSLTQAPVKKYVIIDNGTHVMHLEKNRFKLYEEVLKFVSQTGRNKSIHFH